MIDSPGGNQDIMDRGYDFPGVVRWFASRADIVLVFFDPDKVRSYSIQTHKHTSFLNKIIFLPSRNFLLLCSQFSLELLVGGINFTKY